MYSPGDLPDPGIEPGSPLLQAGDLIILTAVWYPIVWLYHNLFIYWFFSWLKIFGFFSNFLLLWFFFFYVSSKVFFLLLLFFNCSGFCHTLKWISHGFTCIPHLDPPSHLPLHPIPLGLSSAPGLSACLMHPTWVRYHYTPVRMAAIQKSTSDKC